MARAGVPNATAAAGAATAAAKIVRLCKILPPINSLISIPQPTRGHHSNGSVGVGRGVGVAGGEGAQVIAEFRRVKDFERDAEAADEAGQIVQ